MSEDAAADEMIVRKMDLTILARLDSITEKLLVIEATQQLNREILIGPNMDNGVRGMAKAAFAVTHPDGPGGKTLKDRMHMMVGWGVGFAAAAAVLSFTISIVGFVKFGL